MSADTAKDVLPMPTTSFTLEGITYQGASGARRTATVTLVSDTDPFTCGGTGKGGPIEAIFDAIKNGLQARYGLEDFTLPSWATEGLTPGANAEGETTLVVNWRDQQATGTGQSTDVLEATAKAIVDAINQLLELK